MSRVIREIIRIMHEYIRGSIGVASIEDKMRKNIFTEIVWAYYEKKGIGNCKNGYGIER